MSSTGCTLKIKGFFLSPTMSGTRASSSKFFFEYVQGQTPVRHVYWARAGQEHVLLGGFPRPTMWTRTRLDPCILIKILHFAPLLSRGVAGEQECVGSGIQGNAWWFFSLTSNRLAWILGNWMPSPLKALRSSYMYVSRSPCRESDLHMFLPHCAMCASTHQCSTSEQNY